MTIQLFRTAAAAGALLAVCAALALPFESDAETMLRLTPEKTSRTFGACPGRPCLNVSIEYLDAAGGGEREKRFEIELARALELEEGKESLAKLVEEEVEALGEDFQADAEGGDSRNWFVERKASIRHSDDRVLTIQIDSSEFMGGAHPLQTRKFLNFDAATGKLLNLQDVFAEDAADDLVRLAESKFRDARKLAPKESLSQAGFSFANNRFALPRNFAVEGDGVLLYYNPYEVAPYAMGPTEILLERRDLEPLLKREGPLARHSAVDDEQGSQGS